MAVNAADNLLKLVVSNSRKILYSR